MALVTSTEMFKKAYDGGYAIGAFNVNNMEIVQGITEACKEEHAPVILQVSKGARAYANHTYLVKLVEAAVIECPEIPIVLHLDHGPDFETCKACIDGGFTSVMIDASSKPFAENIEITKKVVEYAHDHGVVVEAELDQPEFVTMVADACYHAGARKVTVTWKHQALEKLAIRRESVKTLQTVEAWERAKLQHYVDTLPCRIYLLSEDPDGLRGVSPAKMARARQGRYGVIKPYRDQMEGRYQWCIAAAPGVAWAKKVFPNETKARAVEKLWEAILHPCRVDDDPIAAWNAHNADLQARCDHLNSLGIASLEYHASDGTNLTVGMIPEAQFCGGGEYTIGGSYFNPNLPTEECFISPKRGEAEGIVYSSKPLSYQGQLIEDFSIRFEHGRAVEAHARTNEALLQKLIAMDEGSAYLGECALVPYDSPINQTGILFYNTLFDENACCHLALGMGFIDTIRDYPNRTLEEMRALGVNDSMIHEDFMIGTPDLAITAHCRDGRTVPVFRDGTWAF